MTAMVRFSVLTVLALLALVAPGAAPAFAHPGGHALESGSVVHIWTEPGSRSPVPGTLLFVAGEQVRVEDVSGRMHVWPLAALSDEDRARLAPSAAGSRR